MGTGCSLAAVVALLALCGSALADSGAHYYAPQATHRPGPHAHPGGSHKARGAHRAPHDKVQGGAKAKHKLQHPARHHVK